MAEKILVGIDGSPGSRWAATWALEEARIRKAEIEAIYVWQIPGLAYTAPGFVPPSPEDMAEVGERMADYAFGDTSKLDVHVQIRAVNGRPADVLGAIAADSDIDLVVVGSRGHSGAVGLLLGSVSEALSHQLVKPLVIVPGPLAIGLPPAERRIVIGVDGSAASTAALHWAVHEAEQRGNTALEVVVAWTAPHGHARHSLQRAATDLANRVVDDLGELDLTVIKTVEEGQPAELLLARGASAELLVVGSRRLSRTRAAFVGSVSHACTHRSARPVAVIPQSS